jgi:4-amino-4-deoxy-L-arabinose transferase-like glycosyltransferase
MRTVIVAALSAAVFAAALTRIDGVPVTKDAAQNLQMAINVAHHGVMSMDEADPYRPTMYREPLPVATSALLVGTEDRILGRGQPAQYFSGTRVKFIKYQNAFWLATLWAAAFVATRWLTRSSVAAIIAALIAVRPFLGSASSECLNSLYTELPGAALLTWGSLALAAAVANGRLWLSASAGLCFGLATLTKAATLYVFAGVLLVLLLIWLPARTTTGRPSRLLQIGLMIAGFAVVVGPWLARNVHDFGRFQVADRGGPILYTRALIDQATPVEYRGTFYVWARPSLQPYLGRLLGFGPQDLELGGRLQRLSGESPGTRLYADDTAAEAAGRPDRAISFYRQARAERERLVGVFERAGDANPDAAADAVLQHDGVNLIRQELWRHISLVLPLAWRGAPLLLPLALIALAHGLYTRRYALALFVLPGLATLAFYALLTHFVPRPSLVVYAITAVGCVAMLYDVAQRWLISGRAKQPVAGSSEFPVQ